MKNILIIWKILNLNLKKYDIVSYQNQTNNIIVFWIKRKSKSCSCPQCGIRTTKRQDLKEYKQKINLKHINISNNTLIEIKPIKKYFRCNNCKSNFLERFDFESKIWFHTKTFENYVVASFWYTSWNQIAKLNHVSASKIYKIIEKIDHNKLNEIWLQILEELDEIYLWVDEHSFSGHDMILIITELKTKQLIAVLPAITKKSLDSWIMSLPLKTQIKVKWFSTDMNKWYKNSLKNILWNPVHSVDKYHLFQEANKMVDEVRILNSWLVKMVFVKGKDIIKLGKIPKKITKKDIAKINKNSNKNNIMKKYKEKALQRLKSEDINPKMLKNKKWNKIEYKEITLDYFLETWYRKLFLTREKNLSPFQKLRLNQIFREFDYNGYLAETRTIKEDFMDAIDDLNMKEVDRILDDCKKSEHHRLKQFWRTLTNWYDWIKWFCEHSTDDFKFTNAYTEGFNLVCKNLKRQAHWFRFKSTYFKKILAKSMINKTKIKLLSN